MARKLTKLRIPVVKTAITWAIQWGLWLLFADNAGIREMCIGALAAGFATLGAMVFGSQLIESFKFRLRDLLQGLRMFWCLIMGTGEVMLGLYQQLFTRRGAGSFIRAVPFKIGGNSPEECGRRVLAITFTTATPNFIIFGLVPEKKILLYHQIVKGEVRAMTRNLGARP